MASQSSKSTPKKPKLVRDSFTIPKSEFVAIDALKTRAIAMGTSVKKSELLRAGLMVLQGLSDAAYKAALTAVPTLKTGRPTGAEKLASPTPAKKAAAKAAPKAAVKAASKTATARKPAAKAPTKAPARKAVAKKVPAKKPVAKKAASPAAKTA